MAVANRDLLSLAAQEFRRIAGAGRAVPVVRNFKGLRINLTKFDDSWDRKRGAAVRLTPAYCCAKTPARRLSKYYGELTIATIALLARLREQGQRHRA
jgi:hypothetical protein